MRKIPFILLIVFSCYQVPEAVAQQYHDTVVTDDPVEYNEENYDEPAGTKSGDHKYERAFMDESKLESMRRKKEFQYLDLDSLERISLNFDPKDESTSSSSNRFRSFNANILVWLVVAVAAIVIILQLAGINMRQLFSPGKLKDTPGAGELVPENIHDIPFDSAIRQAVLDKNYPLATRLMYLQGLKILSDKNLVAWHENKTNWQYVYELRNEKLRNSFRNVTHIFEYVQYGHMPLSDEKFSRVQQSFHAFKLNIP